MAGELDISASCRVPEHGRLGLDGWLLFQAARRVSGRSALHRGDGLQRTTDARAYDRWRAQSLRRQLTSHFQPARLRGADVLDFGCGNGDLSLILAAEFGCRSVVGIDLKAKAVAKAEEKRAHLTAQARDTLRFVTATDDRRIELADESVDLICCFDVVEHTPHPTETAAQWRRVLRPGGEVWVWWSPWRGPYGHHVESLIPLPWIHLVLRPRTVFTACAELYDAPDFVPRIWDTDPTTGRKRPNKWRTMTTYEPFLNRLTRRQFERAVRAQRLAIAHRETHGFSGSCKARATQALTRLPVLGECFVSFYVYRLVKCA